MPTETKERVYDLLHQLPTDGPTPLIWGPDGAPQVAQLSLAGHSGPSRWTRPRGEPAGDQPIAQEACFYEPLELIAPEEEPRERRPGRRRKRR